ncbi:bifunctional (p)ppGpp synthetase/guanosine-3',5'-bis(diphosphate) 3'-pyrophosphohydrolase [Vineibacter terrae]|uniref:Bifunctional (P)ppGpp synthetase/guanosine-3',5'-bis(Diphosphate) 3'-pyrophosphohydrolase n=1 Tax=Vineibacter terrae TaxID=2586908 RepID=A0A5C8PV49_9HYPH|nr:HD domain-containing protein [Vineibacter terrae]TXL81974.1 bifunctional (p)ppGpp synthetase/guanosine-3',5'-bis(diphosphate) 3'-pyrophosphohydrolase [Vineibacter terrae]
MDEVLLLTRAFAFAAEKHVHQRRKGANAEPYVNHLAEVAHLLAVAVHGRDANLVAAGLLHDVLEDTQTTRDELAATFNEDIAALVSEVTDDKSLPKQERKRQQVVHAPGKTDRAKMLKLADKTSNLRDLAASPPADWSTERRLDYVRWGRDVVAGLRGVHPWLETQFDDAAATAERALAGK